ncbi:MFS general substrate transporter [Mollisia scopiformis]|uniref:MFS general substrate transporter n=1 Tax=Mollisia scopiformis TaxID=149040 RepID=A0A194XIN9_MOLSC|nr:MFS general substrate transporter [Mollisia scopiformis]KUJ20100.1 MFS general substrate transporter [Mollisia scopiformis]
MLPDLNFQPGIMDFSQRRIKPKSSPLRKIYLRKSSFQNPLPKVQYVSSESESDENGELFKRNPFLDPDVAEHWTAVYEQSQYECRHEFDPTFTWSEEEEKRIIRKLDWRVCLWACVMFFGLQTDRGNLVQALADNMLTDLKLTTMTEYNYGNIIFYLSFLLAELPSQLVSKKIGPDRWIPMQITLWSIVAMSQCAITGKQSFYATRSLLGILEGGFIPDIVLWLSYFYTSRELPTRLSFFWTTLSATTIVTSVLAFALLHLRGVARWAGWRWLFLIEGLITGLVGVGSFFMMPASAVQTKTWFRPKGWFSEREVKIVVNRVLRDDPSKGDMHNRQAITPRRLWNAAKDFDLWPLYAIGLIAYIPQAPPTTYITLTLKKLGFSTFNVNLLTIPYSVFHIITLLLLTRLSEYINERTLVSMLQAIWTLPCVIALRYWPGTMVDHWGTFALVTALLSYPYCHVILVAWTSRNSNNVGARSVSAALYNISVQLGTIISNFIYRTDDAPLYHRGNKNLIIINCLVVGLFLFTKGYYIYRNRQRDREWAAMTPEEQRDYKLNCKLSGSRRKDFRFAH